jgi:hypothetical protein
MPICTSLNATPTHACILSSYCMVWDFASIVNWGIMRAIVQLVNYYIMVVNMSIQIKQIISVMNMTLETQLCLMKLSYTRV